MGRSLSAWTMAGLFLLAGCDRSPEPGVASAPAAERLDPPARTAGADKWRAFASRVVEAETRNPSVHPFTFVVPAGNDIDAQDQRKAITAAVRGMLSNTALPGNTLAFTGSDSPLVAGVIVDALRDLPGLPARGITFLFIGTPDASADASKAVRSAGGNLRIRPLAPSR